MSSDCEFFEPLDVDEAWGFLRNEFEELFSNTYTLSKPEDVADFGARLHSFICKSCSIGTTVETHLEVAGELYKRVKEFIENYVNNLMKIGCVYEDVLDFYATQWVKYKAAIRILDNGCSYLNHVWVNEEINRGSNGIYHIYPLGLVIWRDNLFRSLQQQLTYALLQLIRIERKGRTIDQKLISLVTGSYVDLGLGKKTKFGQRENLCIYEEAFEKVFLLDTEMFYSDEGCEFITKKPFTEYLKMVEQRLIEERNRVRQYLHNTTQSTVVKTCMGALVIDHLHIFKTHFERMISSENYGDLGCMFRLVTKPFSNYQVKDELINCFQCHFSSQGQYAIKTYCESGSDDVEVYFGILLDVYRKYSNILKISFKSDKDFVLAFEIECRKFVNDNEVTKKGHSSTKAIDLFLKYYDLIAERLLRSPEDVELEQTFKEFLMIFKYVVTRRSFALPYSPSRLKPSVSFLYSQI